LLSAYVAGCGQNGFGGQARTAGLSMIDCVFCGILSGELPGSFVYQDDRRTALMDIQPVNAGHVLVIPNRHAASLDELDDSLASHMLSIARQVAARLRRGDVRCEGVNLLVADGEAAGQEVFHVHLHVIPRFAGDGFGFKFRSGYKNRPDRSELDALAARLRITVP